MGKILVLAIFATMLIKSTDAQDTALLQRTPSTLRVAVDKNNFYEQQIGATPYLLPDNTIQIYPGETIYMEVTSDSGAIKSMKVVKQIINPKSTITIKFSQKTENKVHQMMMLEIQNPFSEELTYHAKMFLLKNMRWVNTDVYPVAAGLSGFETWNDIIISLGLDNWKFTSK
jgi:hypothetical protein